METRKNQFLILDSLALLLIVINVLFLIARQYASSHEGASRDFLVPKLVIWLMILAVYTWNLRVFSKNLFVKWVLLPFNVCALTFFMLVATRFGKGISNDECFALFIPFYLLFIPFHLIVKTTLQNRALSYKLSQIVRYSFIFAALGGLSFQLYLFHIYRWDWLWEELVIALIFGSILFSISLILLLSTIHVISIVEKWKSAISKH